MMSRNKVLKVRKNRVAKITGRKRNFKIKRKKSTSSFKTKYKPTVSKVEKEFGEFIVSSLNIELQKQLKIDYKYYDFLVKGTNLIIEMDGDYWHANPIKYPKGPINRIQLETIQNDSFKEALAYSRGYKILRIWENDFRNNKEKVLKDIRKYLKENNVKK